jgi:hypothetical protein
VKWKLTETVIAENDNADDDDVVKITRGDDDASSALMDIGVILCCFSKCPILYNCGDIYIHLKHDISMYNEVISNAHTKTVPLKGLNDMSIYIHTFVLVGLERDKVSVLPKNAMTYSLFDKLGIVEKSIRPKFSVALKDLIPIYFKMNRRQRKHVSGYLNLELRTFGQGPEIFQNNKIISIRKKRHSSIYSPYRFRRNVLRPRCNSRMRIFIHYPVEEEQFNFPIQAGIDNLENEQEELVPSAFTPALHFGENLSLVTSALPSTATGRPTVPPRYREYVNYHERLASFERWPHQSPTSRQLSEAGFFSTSETFVLILFFSQKLTICSICEMLVI